MILESIDYLEERFGSLLCLRGVYLLMGRGSGCDDYQTGIFLGMNTLISILITMANLASYINGLRTIYELAQYISNDKDCIKNADWPNDLCALQLNTWLANTPGNKRFADFYNFSSNMENVFVDFIDKFDAYNKATKAIYLKNDFWLLIEKSPEWHSLKKSASKLADCFILYFDSLGISYRKVE